MVGNHLTNPPFRADRDRSAFYPSEASIISRTDGKVIGKCHRAVWYRWAGVPETNPTDACGAWTMNVGKKIEEMYIEYSKQMGLWVANNIKYYDKEHNVSGEVDLIVHERSVVDERETEELMGIEIKTAYGYGFQKNVKSFAKIENLLQVALYLDFFKFPKWRLVYKSRDTMEDVEYTVTMAQDDKGKYLIVSEVPVRMFYIEDIYARYQQLGEYVIKNEMPPRDYTYGYAPEQTANRMASGEISKSKASKIKRGAVVDTDWNCLYCSHLDECWKQKRQEIINKQQEALTK